MKAILENRVVDAWKISIIKPREEQWVIDEFKKRHISWSGRLVMEKKEELKEKNYTNFKCIEWDWITLYSENKKISTEDSYDLYLVINLSMKVGKIGQYLVKSQSGSLSVYSKDQAQQNLFFI